MKTIWIYQQFSLKLLKIYLLYYYRVVITETKMHSTVQPLSVQSLSDLHWALCGAIHKTNAIFSWQLLAFMMLLFLQIIITPYYLFYSMSLYARGQQSSVFLFHLASQFLWMLTHFSKLVLLIWPCSMTTQEVSWFLGFYIFDQEQSFHDIIIMYFQS